jgi:outer membrane protein
MKKILALASLFLLFTGDVSAARPAAFHNETAAARSAAVDSLTVEEAVRLTLENHPLIHEASDAVAASGARAGLNRSSYYPDVFLAGLYTRLDPIQKIDMPGLGSFELFPEDNYDFHLGIRQTIYDFGRIAASVELAESARRSAEDCIDVVKSDLAYRTVDVFDAMLILRRTIAVLDEQIETLEQHLEVSAKKIRAGAATEFDSLTTKVRIAAAENDRIDALRSLETHEIALRQLTGFPPQRPINPKGTIDADPVVLDPDSVLAAAMRQRPELAVSKDAESSAAIQAKLASLSDRPSLAFSMTSGFKNGYVPDLTTLKANLAAGVQLQVPLFDGHRTRYREKEADANLRSARANTENVERRIVSEVEQALAGVKSSLDKIRNSAIQVRQAEAARLMAETQYEAGTVTNLDLLDVQTALSQAKLIRLRAIYDYVVSRNALDKATGRTMW